MRITRVVGVNFSIFSPIELQILIIESNRCWKNLQFSFLFISISLADQFQSLTASMIFLSRQIFQIKGRKSREKKDQHGILKNVAIHPYFALMHQNLYHFSLMDIIYFAIILINISQCLSAGPNGKLQEIYHLRFLKVSCS